MKIHQFLEHHGLTENPFAQEDAQSDDVFLHHCLEGTHHPAWDKIFGTPDAPSTSVVFGEQGSGKTALRLQMIAHLRQYNRNNPGRRAFIVEYDDFNPFLDSFRERLSSRKRRPDRAIQSWELWDHMDAILSLATTRLVDLLIAPKQADEADRLEQSRIDALGRLQRRDILLLTALYDRSRDMSQKQRFNTVRRKLSFSTWKAYWDVAVGLLVTILTVALVLLLAADWRTIFSWWVPVLILVGWLPFLFHRARLWWQAANVTRQIRVIDHRTSALRKVFAQFERSEILGQPLPMRQRGDDRYEMLHKLQSVLNTLGYSSIVVLVDRVDEPHLINGSPERIRDLLWPMFDNKFLKHQGIAFKMLLPKSVTYYLDRQEKEFYQRSRLDKQNMIPSLEWSGQALYDVVNDRIRACSRGTERRASVTELFEETIDEKELIDIFARLRVPRHLFKFCYRLLVDHCSKYTEDHPVWKINRETLQATLAVFMRDLDSYDRGQGTM